MCLIPSYTEIEKNLQVQKVLHLMTLPLDTEAKRKDFLYNLSFMNNMVVKGYKQERTAMDAVIYATKEAAISFLGQKMPGRCIQSGDVVYMYAAGRQYSFHTKFAFVEIPRKYVPWNHIEGGWELSDEEYRKTVESMKLAVETEKKKNCAEKKAWERNIKKSVIRQIHLLQRNRERVEEFKRVMEEKITPAQRRTKTYKEYQRCNFYWEHCWELWGEKWGFGSYPPETFFYAWKCACDDKAGERYAETYYNKIKSYYKL